MSGVSRQTGAHRMERCPVDRMASSQPIGTDTVLTERRPHDQITSSCLLEVLSVERRPDGLAPCGSNGALWTHSGLFSRFRSISGQTAHRSRNICAQCGIQPFHVLLTQVSLTSA